MVSPPPRLRRYSPRWGETLRVFLTGLIASVSIVVPAARAQSDEQVQLILDDVPVNMQVLVAPLETTGAGTDALLVFLRPVTVVAPA